MKLSFCVTCMNRLYHLEQTLLDNLQILKQLPAEIVLVNYNSQDALDSWIRKHCMSFIEQGTLRYIHEQTAQHFHAPRAKNLAHFMATGNVLFNLDADNFIGEAPQTILPLVATPRWVIHGWSGTYYDGTYGRIAMPREQFYALGGYDEQLLAMGYEDSDLIERAKAIGASYKHLPSGQAIKNTKEEGLRHTGTHMQFQEMNEENKRRSQHNIATGRFRANPNGWHPHRISVNFAPLLAV
jgi:predicted glycosyltransferase involved in capsule biosynthesis